MAKHFLAPLLSLFRLSDRTLTRFSVLVERHRWISLLFNGLGSLVFAYSAFLQLPGSPFHAIFQLMIGVILFGCFVGDALLLCLSAWMILSGAWIDRSRTVLPQVANRPPLSAAGVPHPLRRRFRLMPRRSRLGAGTTSR